jgi:hypothetical protein
VILIYRRNIIKLIVLSEVIGKRIEIFALLENRCNYKSVLEFTFRKYGNGVVADDLDLVT